MAFGPAEAARCLGVRYSWHCAFNSALSKGKLKNQNILVPGSSFRKGQCEQIEEGEKKVTG